LAMNSDMTSLSRWRCSVGIVAAAADISLSVLLGAPLSVIPRLLMLMVPMRDENVTLSFTEAWRLRSRALARSTRSTSILRKISSSDGSSNGFRAPAPAVPPRSARDPPKLSSLPGARRLIGGRDPMFRKCSTGSGALHRAESASAGDRSRETEPPA